MSAATDAAIIAFARRFDWTIVTLDSDFHTALAIQRSTSPSVLWFRWEGLKGAAMATQIDAAAAAVTDDLIAGSLVTIGPGRLVVRHLPIV